METTFSVKKKRQKYFRTLTKAQKIKVNEEEKREP